MGLHLAEDAPHILMIDDDRRIRALASRYLSQRGYRVTTATHAADARVFLDLFQFDLIVLDVMMPGETGFEFIRWLRSHSDIPVLFLTARMEVSDRILGLELGADDYLVKPFEPRELSLRIASILRRTPPLSKISIQSAVRFGSFIFLMDRLELWQGEELIHLTEREKVLFQHLLRNPGEPVSREELAGEGVAAHERTIDMQINRLRRKIEVDPANPRYLQTLRGTGYRMVVDV